MERVEKIRGYVVFTQQKAEELIRMGYKLRKVRPDNKNPNYNVFIFEDENNIREAMKTLMNNNK